MNLQEKIDYEYRCFFLDQMRTSRENIFARSGEIECKKKLKKELDSLAGQTDGPVQEILLVKDNLLESAFRFLQDNGTESEPMTVTVQRWFESVQAGG